MVTGSIILTLVYPLIFLNEYKRLVHAKVMDTIDEKLEIVEKGRTNKSNENRLIFAQGPLSFSKPAKDDLLQFESKDGIVLKREVEIYQWQAKYHPELEQQYFYEKIWSQRIIDSTGYPEDKQNPQTPCMPF